MTKKAYECTSKEVGSKIIEYLISQGGINNHRYTGNSIGSYYYIDKVTNIIEFRRCIPFEYEEALLPDSQEIRIQIPEGYEIDTENSTFECIKFKKKELTYEEIEHKVLSNPELHKKITKKHDTLLKLLVLQEYFGAGDFIPVCNERNELQIYNSPSFKHPIQFSKEGCNKAIEFLKEELEEYFKD